MNKQLFALWLVPQQNDCVSLKKVIDDLATSYNAPLFEPHVTLYASVDDVVKNDIQDTASQLAQILQPIILKPSRVNCTDTLFKSLFIEFERNPDLERLFQTVNAECNKYGDYQFIPHLSLMYKMLGANVKEQIISEISVPETITFDRLAFVFPAEGNIDWTDITGWQITHLGE